MFISTGAKMEKKMFRILGHIVAYKNCKQIGLAYTGFNLIKAKSANILQFTKICFNFFLTSFSKFFGKCERIINSF